MWHQAKTVRVYVSGRAEADKVCRISQPRSCQHSFSVEKSPKLYPIARLAGGKVRAASQGSLPPAQPINPKKPSLAAYAKPKAKWKGSRHCVNLGAVWYNKKYQCHMPAYWGDSGRVGIILG